MPTIKQHVSRSLPQRTAEETVFSSNNPNNALGRNPSMMSEYAVKFWTKSSSRLVTNWSSSHLANSSSQLVDLSSYLADSSSHLVVSSILLTSPLLVYSSVILQLVVSPSRLVALQLAVLYIRIS